VAYITWRPYANPTDPAPFFCLDKHNREVPLSIPVPPYPLLPARATPTPLDSLSELWRQTHNSV
jgi:hypothetical protein